MKETEFSRQKIKEVKFDIDNNSARKNSVLMIRNTRHRREADDSEQQRRSSNIIEALQRDLREYNHDLSDQVCVCYVNEVITAKSRFVKVQLFLRPASGVYQGIEFRPTIYYKADDICSAPKVYNDRKIYHPNIDIFTNELAVPELVDWNPSVSCVYLIRRIKYVLIEPNSVCVPNNPFNRKACFLYLFSREKLRDAVLQNCPTFLEEQVGNVQPMIQEQNEKGGASRFIDLKEFYPIFRTPVQKQEETESLEMNLLCKRVKVLNIGQEEEFDENSTANSHRMTE